MIELRLKYTGGGKFVAATKWDFDRLSTEFEAGEEVRAKVMRPRSSKANAWFHAFIRHAYERQTAGPKLASWECLKDWLLIENGWCKEVRKECGRLTPKEVSVIGTMLALALRTEHDFVGVAYDPKREEMILRTAKTTANTSQEKFSELSAAVEATVLQEICPGLTVEQIMGEARAA